ATVGGRVGRAGAAGIEQHELELPAETAELAEVERREPRAAGVADEGRAGAEPAVGEPAPVRRRQSVHLPSTTRSLPARSGVIVTCSYPSSSSSRRTRSPAVAA